MVGFACSRCLVRQLDGGRCARCGAEVFDLGSRRERALIEGAEDRAHERRQRRIHFVAMLCSMLIGVPVAFAIVFLLPLATGVPPGRLMTLAAAAAAIGPALIVEAVLAPKRRSMLDGIPAAERP